MSERFAVLLNSGEKVEKLDLRGWIVLNNLLKIDDPIIIDECYLFDRPVRARVTNISSHNLIAIELLTEGAKDSYGDEWTKESASYWMDIMSHVYKITPA